MKNAIVFIFSISMFLNLNVNAQGGNVNQKNANGKKVGAWRDYHSSGILRYEGQFNEDKPFGVFKYYFATGEIKTVLRYRKPNEAFATHYYTTGEKMAEGKYLNQLKDSIWNSYGAQNSLVETGQYIRGEKTGMWKTFHINGQVSEEIFMKNDVEQETFKVYFPNGQLKQIAFYKDGFLDGETIFYSPEGKKTLWGRYNLGRRDKNWLYYSEKQQIEKKLIYDKGKLMNPEELDEEDFNKEEFKNNRKKVLDFEDLRGKIKYE